MRINFLNLKKQWRLENKFIYKEFNKYLKDGVFVGGKIINKLEKKISKKIGRRYTVTLNSGTDALMLALWSIGVKKGDEVITQSNSFIATAGAISHIGAIPVFVDVDQNQQIDVGKIEKKITKKTKAIIPVHLTGKIGNMKQIIKISNKYKIPIIEDAAQAFGSKKYNLFAGNFSLISCFSAHPLKNLNACGDSGFLVTNNFEIYKKIKNYSNHGLENRNHSTQFGINSRMDTLQAIILNYRLKNIDFIIKKRRENAKVYYDNLDIKEVKLIKEEKDDYFSHHLFVIKVLNNKRDHLKRFLKSKGVETSIHYPIPIHMQKAYKYKYKNIKLPNTEIQSKQILSLPINEFLNQNEIKYIIKMIKTFFKNVKKR